MNATYEKYKDRGLVVLAVSNEPAGKLDKWVEQRSPSYPVVSAPAGSRTYGVRGYPTYVLVSASGRVISQGHPTPAQIEAALESVVQFPEVPRDSSRLSRLRKDAGEGDIADVAKSLARATQDSALSAEEKAAVDRVQEYFQALCKKTMTEIGAMNGPNYLAHVERLEEIAKAFKGLPVADDAKARLDSFKKDKKIKGELKAMQRLTALRRKYDPSKRSQAKKLYAALEKLIRAEKGTYAAQRAEAMLNSRR